MGFFVYRQLELVGCNISIMKRSWIIFLVILFGCATTYQNLPIPDSESIKSENVRIKITRTESLQGGGKTFEVYDDGKFVGNLGFNKPLVWDRPAGEVNLSIRLSFIAKYIYNFSPSIRSSAISFSTEPNKVYELYLDWSDGFTNKSSFSYQTLVPENLLLFKIAYCSISLILFMQGVEKYKPGM